MRFTLPRLRTLICGTVLVAGCKADRPLAPGADAAALAASVAAGSGAPSGLTSTAVLKSRIDLAWQDNSSNETGFEVQRSTTGSAGTFAAVGTVGADVTTYGDAGLSPLTQYCHRVRAFRRTGGKTSYSGFSNTACATTPGPPSAASNVSATPESSSAVGVTWSDNSGTEDGFRVERSAASTGPWETAATTGPNVTSYRDGGRTSEQQVCYRIVAFNAHGEAPLSNTDCTAPPAAPTSLTATPADRAVDLAWTDNSAVEDVYEVQRSTDGVTFGALANLPANSTSYHDAGVASSTTNWYRVRAKKDGGFSDLSNTASAETAACVPTSTTEVCDNGTDDDCDGLVDSADPDCACATPYAEQCSNGVDDDCDGLIDYSDPDCQLLPCGADVCPYGYGCFPDSYCHSHCEDGAPDYDESASDCGGGDCRRCQAGQHCNDNYDCASNSCVNNICQ
jgi:fibronectin type III domain protein